MDETAKGQSMRTFWDKSKRTYFFWVALIFSIAASLIPFVAPFVLGLAMGWYGILPPCSSCDDPNTGGQMFAGILILYIFGSGILLMIFSEIISLIFAFAEYIKKETNKQAILPMGILLFNFFILIVFLVVGFRFAELITKIFWGCKCYGYTGG